MFVCAAEILSFRFNVFAPVCARRLTSISSRAYEHTSWSQPSRETRSPMSAICFIRRGPAIQLPLNGVATDARIGCYQPNAELAEFTSDDND